MFPLLHMDHPAVWPAEASGCLKAQERELCGPIAAQWPLRGRRPCSQAQAPNPWELLGMLEGYFTGG